MCVGGEDAGHFAVIKVDGNGPRTLDVDSALPLDYSEREDGRRAASVKLERIGEEIVNSISIHRIQDEAAHLDDIVAVLTNNDKTVRLYSLPQNLETTVLDLPFAMNHATISPDGAMLVAVGDLNQAYFFSRQIHETPPQIPKPHNRLTSSCLGWKLTSVVPLHVSGPASTLGYFTTAWSPSSRLVALGSEGGYITVFEVDMLCDPNFEDEEAIVAVIPSSRPDAPTPHPGAVRSMLFSPDPWDLLIWAEDQGRVCISDLRTSLRRKQVVNLEPKDEKLHMAAYEDMPSEASPVVPHGLRSVESLEADLVRMHRRTSGSGNVAEINFATEYIEARARQREQREMASQRQQMNLSTSGMRAAAEDDPQGLTAREQQILESLRTTRQREEARAPGQTPRSVNYTTPDMFINPDRSLPPTYAGAISTRPTSDTQAAVPDTFPELSRTNAQTSRPPSSHGRSHDASTPASPPFQAMHPSGSRSNDSSASRLPRRQASVILSLPGGANAVTSGISSRRLESPATVHSAEETEDDNPWRTVLRGQTTLARGALFNREERAQATSPRLTDEELQIELSSERHRARLLARQRDRWRHGTATGPHPGVGSMGTTLRPANVQDGYEAVLRRTQLRGFPSRDVGVRTAGLAMSPDGRTLWAACEEGIFQIEINVKSRMFWPSIEPR